MTVRCKFRCQSVTERWGPRFNTKTRDFDSGPSLSVELHPVYDPDDLSHENRKFWEATPAGSLKLDIIEVEAGAMFKPGETYYIDITKTEPTE